MTFGGPRNRRRVPASLCTALLVALALHGVETLAQAPARVARVGFVAAANAADVASRVEAFRQGLRELGYVEGRNIVVEYRYAGERLERLPALVGELVRLPVDVIVSAGPSVTRAARNATASIPIVMAFDTDPVGSGSVASLGRPGGNVTGTSALATELAAKQLEFVKAMLPNVARVAVVENSQEPANADALRATRMAAERLGLQVDVADVRQAADIEPAFRFAAKRRADAMLFLSSPLVLFHRSQIAQLAASQRVPAIYPYVDLVEAGGLVTYGVHLEEQFRRSATFVDRLLRGAKAAELPVELPTKFVLVINRRAAARIGLDIPRDVLARADRVID